MSEPALTVVLPVHNGMPYVESSVRSLLAQDFRDFELVVGDDGSDDGTTEILAALAGEDARIRVLRRQTKSGLAASANWVVSQARAPLVAIAHADDVARPDRLRRQLEVMQAEPRCVIVGAMSTGIDEAGREVHPANLWRLAFPNAYAPMPHSSILFRRSAFDQVGGYRPAVDYWEDLDLYLRMSELGDILVLPHALTDYRYSRASARERGNPADLERALEVMYEAVERHRCGADYDQLLTKTREEVAATRIHPRIFVARSWKPVWTGQRTPLLGRMLRRARLRCDLTSAQSLVFVLWAAVSPKSLRWFLQVLTRGRNGAAVRIIGDRPWVRWSSRGQGPPP